MVTYYVIVNKKDIHKKSGLLPSEKFGFSTVGNFPFATSNHHSGLDLYAEFKGAHLAMNPKTQTILKVESAGIRLGNKEAGESMVSIHRVSGDSLQMMGGYVDTDIKLNIVSQIMPDGTERTKNDARSDEMKKFITKKESPMLKAATYILQKGIDIKERNVGKQEKTEQPQRKM